MFEEQPFGVQSRTTTTRERGAGVTRGTVLSKTCIYTYELRSDINAIFRVFAVVWPILKLLQKKLAENVSTDTHNKSRTKNCEKIENLEYIMEKFQKCLYLFLGSRQWSFFCVLAHGFGSNFRKFQPIYNILGANKSGHTHKDFLTKKSKKT